MEFSKRKIKEVDAKHLLFLYGEWTAKQCWLGLNGLSDLVVVVQGDLVIKVAMMPSFLRTIGEVNI